MLKIFTFVGYDPPLSKVSEINWSLCILCQSLTNEKLKCPAKSKRLTVCGYQSLSSNLLSFHEIDSIPHNIKISHLDDGIGLETSLKKNSASWHDSCRIKFNKTELVRARKRIET